MEQTLRQLCERFAVREIRFDPYQLVAVAQRLTNAGLPMIEWPQSVPNLTESSTNLYELIKAGNLAVYVDPDIRLSLQRAVALETSRGWRIAKEKAVHKIDILVALAIAALGAVKGQEMGGGVIGFANLAQDQIRVGLTAEGLHLTSYELQEHMRQRGIDGDLLGFRWGERFP